MKNLTQILGIPLIALATMFPIGCDMTQPTPPVITGTLNAHFLNAPYSYSVILSAKGSNKSNSKIGGMNSGGTTCSVGLLPDTYNVSASGLEYVSKPAPWDPNYKIPVPHYSNEAYTISVTAGNSYDVNFTLN